MRTWLLAVGLLGLVTTLNLGGCSIQLPEDWNIDLNGDDDDDDLGGLEALAADIEVVQEEDPRDVELPEALVEAGTTVIINADVDIVINIEEQVVVEELPDALLVGFENLTGYDIYVQYYADDELQGALVYDGETLLLDYWCLASLELVAEDDLDPLTGLMVESWELDALYLNPDDFLCGDALVFVFDPVGIELTYEVYDLVE